MWITFFFENNKKTFRYESYDIDNNPPVKFRIVAVGTSYSAALFKIE
jgi:hypothetical protein